MALSGSFYTNVNSHWRLQLEWTATQNIEANTSTVTAKLYWMALDSYGAISSSATKDGAIIIDGTTYTFSGAGLASLSANQKKLLYTASKTITHNSDGTKTISLDGYFDAEVTLSGTYYGRVDLTATSYSLNTIPRASSLTSTSQASWTAGNNTTFGISRASSSFTHKITIKVDGVTIKTLSGVGTSASSAFSTAENTTIFSELAQTASKGTTIVLDTYSGSTLIGSKTYTGTCTAPNASTATIDNPTGVSDTAGQEKDTVWYDQTINLTISSANSAFTHTVRFKDGNSGNIVKEFTGVTTSVSWTPSSTEKNAILTASPNSIELDGQIDIITYYNGVQVRTTQTPDINYRIRNQAPTFAGNFTYKDSNGTTVGITGNDQYIIQNKSLVQLTILAANKATAPVGATIANYVVTLNGVQTTIAYSTSDIVQTLGTVSAGTNVSLSVKAVDSRGVATEVTKTVTVIPYSLPVQVKTAKRANGFENDTTLTLKSTISSLTVGGVQKNSIKSMKYRYKAKSVADWTGIGYSTFTTTASANVYTATDVVLNLDNTQAYDIEFYTEDQLGITSEIVTVLSGQPILFVDADKKAVGVGKFTDKGKSLEVGSNGVYIDGGYFELNAYNSGYGSGKFQTFYDANNKKLNMSGREPDNTGVGITLGVNRIELGSNVYASSGGGLDLNNSDIIGANQIFMNDSATSDSEAIQWARDNTPAGSTNSADYDSFRVYNGTAYINSVPISVAPMGPQLWNGASYMNDAQTVTPTKKLSDCANGWVLVWSDYDPPSATASDSDLVCHFIPKRALQGNLAGKWWTFVLGTYTTNILVKYLLVYNDKLTGHSYNDDGSANSTGAVPNDAVLRYIWEW
ncbi:DUF859 family phage minor structural protein [Neobacillus vireti]|uniref:DUF859 family phage minor structural protein n=1 Tax=Neobacillus vireti TaxID=220686 RepID=UPI002FFFA028